MFFKTVRIALLVVALMFTTTVGVFAQDETPNDPEPDNTLAKWLTTLVSGEDGSLTPVDALDLTTLTAWWESVQAEAEAAAQPEIVEAAGERLTIRDVVQNALLTWWTTVREEAVETEPEQVAWIDRLRERLDVVTAEEPPAEVTERR